jgi:hypothetical protein
LTGRAVRVPGKGIVKRREVDPAEFREAKLSEVGKADRQAHIAQSVEHSLGKGEVIGSNPIVSTIYIVG